jgi:hypothetical protein
MCRLLSEPTYTAELPGKKTTPFWFSGLNGSWKLACGWKAAKPRTLV